MRANLTDVSIASPRTPLFPKTSISLAKRVIRGPLALQLAYWLALNCCKANGSRIADFSIQIKDLEKSRVRDDERGRCGWKPKVSLSSAVRRFDDT